MKRPASPEPLVDLEAPSTSHDMDRCNNNNNAERKPRAASLARLASHKLVLVALLAAVFVMSAVVITLSTSELLQLNVFRGVKTSLDMEATQDVSSNDEEKERGKEREKEKEKEKLNYELEKAHRAAQLRIEQFTKQLQKAKMHREIALSLSHYAHRTTAPRGIVLPLFDDIALLGMSIILELRALQVDLPIEIPHCGDLKPEFQHLLQSKDANVRVYNICLQAQAATNVFGSGKKLFCGNMKNCHYRFRGFHIKILATIFSQFEEVMLVDADTIFFQNPMQLWESEKYKTTGTLFFHDRISSSDDFLAERVSNTTEGQKISMLHKYLSTFDVTPFELLVNIPRAEATVKNAMPVQLPFKASDFLLSSHSWNLRAGHEMDSSLVLWNKSKQPRATAILASFISRNGISFPPSYGDKELFFLACELAETEYAFSDFGVGSLGSDLHADGDTPNSVLCGGGLHYLPTATPGMKDVQPLYLNSDDILTLDVVNSALYRTLARPADFYAGSFIEKDLPQECPFGITALQLSADEKQTIARRQALYKETLVWMQERRAPNISI
uniref:Nucleotide-diphospho-sugar transferase domain-containing protein n=1 Tax=Globisporangium ultimum (strain ATCC 200006 / CBS 805.95 / DAOM BR144) TaxID=431595 RepID=K3W5Y0_GLOUD